MKKRIAKWLVKLAKRLDAHAEFEAVDHYTARRLGTGYHITKADVKSFRKEHPEYTSHRRGLDALVQDTKSVILGHIVAGILDNGLVDYKVKKSFWTADVIGTLNVYVRDNASLTEQVGDRDNGNKEDSEDKVAEV